MNVNGIASYSAMSTPAFGRKLKKNEKEPCAQAVKDGLKTLDKDFAIILPTNCVASYKSKDFGTGQPYCSSSRELVIPFMQQWGISLWQQEPNFFRKPTDASPYVSNSSAYNTMSIDIEELTQEKGGKLLTPHTYNDILKHNPKKGEDRSAYRYSIEAEKRAVLESYGTFKYKLGHLEDLTFPERYAILTMEDDLIDLKKTKGEEMEKNAIYSILSEQNGNDYWPNWRNEVDKTLFDKPTNKIDKRERETRLAEIRKEYKFDIEMYMFGQMLAQRAIKHGNQELDDKGIKQSSDIPVGISDAEVWANKDLFSKNLRMGCSEPWSKEPQYWGFRVLDPEKMFKEDGSLGEAGQFLYDKYERIFKENKGGVRIDHIVGLMDPFVYDENDKSKCGRLYSELYPGVNGDPERCDRILKEIVLPAAENAGLDSSNIVAEDLGFMPNKTKQALNDLGVRGISVTQWLNSHEAWNAPRNNVAMIGSHDTPTAKELYPDKNERRSKFVELFSSGAKNIQVFWTDILGIKERYNEPGTTGDKNWSLRMTENFNDEYHGRLEEDDALNVPEVILEANRKRDPDFDRKHNELSKELEHWSNVLREKSTGTEDEEEY